jgi:hypothetical protein
MAKLAPHPRTTLRWSRFGLAARPSVLVVRRLKRTDLHPLEPRGSGWRERQRLDAFELVTRHRDAILAAAQRYGVAPEAIAGTILWDPLENPYRRAFLRLGPGRVYPRQLVRPSEAERVEAAGLVESTPRHAWARLKRLRRPEWAITYIAAIMRRHADNYLRIASVDISADAPVLCTLYQGGKSEKRAERLTARRRVEPDVRPRPADEMGLWLSRHLDFVARMLGREPMHAILSTIESTKQSATR